MNFDVNDILSICAALVSMGGFYMGIKATQKGNKAEENIQQSNQIIKDIELGAASVRGYEGLVNQLTEQVNQRGIDNLQIRTELNEMRKHNIKCESEKHLQGLELIGIRTDYAELKAAYEVIKKKMGIK